VVAENLGMTLTAPHAAAPADAAASSDPTAPADLGVPADARENPRWVRPAAALTPHAGRS